MDKYVDDILAGDKVDFIVGKYAPTLLGVLLWWLDPGQFNLLPYWRSWWSENAEDFFQSCLALFRKGHNFSNPENAMPMSQKKWEKKHSLVDCCVCPFVDGALLFGRGALASVI
jgi:hypothetical protein